MARPTSSKPYVDALTRRYNNDLQKKGLVVPRQISAPAQSAPPAYQGPDMAAVLSQIGGPAESSETEQSFLEKIIDPNRPVGKVLDVISQPLYAGAQLLGESIMDVREDGWAKTIGDRANPLNIPKNAARYFGNYGTGNSKNTISDIIGRDAEFVDQDGQIKSTGYDGLKFDEDDGFLDKAGKFSAGLAMDIAGDPTTYIGAGAVKGVATAPIKAARAVKEIAPEGGAIARGATSVEGALSRAGETATALTRRGRRNKGLSELPEEISDELDIASALSPANKDQVADLLSRLSREADADSIAVRAAENGADDMVDAVRVTSEAATDAEKIADGTFVPKVNTTNATRIGDLEASGPREAGLRPASGKGKTRPYSEALATMMRRTDDAEADLMYPNLAEADIRSPFREVAKKRAESAKAAEAVADPVAVPKDVTPTPETVAAINDVVSKEDILSAIQQQKPGAGTMGLSFTSHYALANAKDARAAEKIFEAMPRKERLSLTTNGITPEFAANAESLIARSQAVLGKIEGKISESRRAQAPLSGPQNGATKGLAAAEGTPAPAKAKVSEATAKKIERVSEKSKVPAASKVRKPKFRRLSGAALNSYRRGLILNHGINPVHVEELLALKTEAGFNARLAQMKTWRTDGPAYEVIEKVLRPTPLPEDDLLAAVKEGVETANEQIIAGKAGNLTAEDFAAASTADLSRETFEAIQEALGSGVGKQQWTDVDSSMKFRTDVQGTLRNSEKYGEGIGVNRNSINAKAQMNIAQNLLKRASESATAQGLKQSERAAYIRSVVVPGLEESDMFFRSMGIQPVVTRTVSGWPLSMADFIKVIESTTEGRAFMDGRVWDGFGKSLSWRGLDKSAPAGTIQLDALFESARPILDTLFEEFPDLAKVEDLAKTVKGISKAGINVKTDRALKDVATQNPMRTLAADEAGKYRGKIVPKENADYVAQELANVLLKGSTLRSLFQTVHNNAAAAGLVFGQRVNEIAEASINKVVNALADPYMGTKTLIDEISIPTSTRVANDARAAGINADAAVLDTAGRTYDEAITEALTVGDRINAEYIMKISQAVKNGEGDRAIAQMYDQYRHAVSEGFHAETLSRLMQSGDNALIAMNSGISRFLQPLASRFLHHWDNPTLHKDLLSQTNLGRVIQSAIRKDLNAVQAAHTPEALREGIRLIQAGVPYTSMTGDAGEAAKALADTVDLVFRADAAGTNGMYSQFVANGYNIDHIIDKMSKGRIQLPESLRFDKAKATEDAARNGTSVAEELGKQWTKWDIENPIDFLGRMSTVMGSLTTDASITFEGLRTAMARNLAASTKRKGFIKYVGENSDSVIAKYLPAGTWLHPDIASEFRALDKILTQSSDINPFIENTLGVLIQKWKAGMTIYHPGHHIRNAIGDGVMSYLINGVSNPKYYARATRAMAGGRNIRRGYSGWDGFKAMQGQTAAMESGKFAARVKLHGGRSVDISDLELQQAMMKRGILPDFATQEDIINYADSAGSGAGFARAVNNFKPARGKVQALAGGVSEARDDLFRQAAFMSVLEHPPTKVKWANIDEALDYAAERVRKAHPDGSDLTQFERKMRMLFPFYSWTRKAIPLILEATLMTPGRVMQYPKAMYNWAQTNGMDLESMSVPFPKGELFPDFLTDQMTGPLFRDDQGHAIGLDFGFPQADLANDFLANPLTGVTGMLNPLVKMPIELATGSRLGQRTPISNTGEYIDSNIPMVSQFAQLTGYSPTNTVFGGEGPAQQTAVEKGNKAAIGTGDGPLGIDREALLNRTLNMRYTDYQKPSYERLAQIQERDRVAKERESN